MRKAGLVQWVIPAAVCCCLVGGCVEGVRITKLDVPAVALEGDQVHLRCDYEEESPSSLYTLKWYKNEQEFFRHQPGLTPSEGEDRCRNHHHYHVDGVSVDCWVSTEKDVVLQGVTGATSGDYQCEVIGDYPTFRKETHKARLTVFTEPLQKPLIAGVRDSYTPLETVSLTCTATNKQYLPLLSWRINGNPVPQEYVINYSDRHALDLRFVARSDLFVRGVITVTCLASFGGRHLQAAEETLANAHYRGTHDFYYNGGTASGGGEVLLTATLLAVVLMALCRRLY
ncbi:uncharacterized protein LOC123513195 [Portunus trituberculatus]|uniref:uncharacterized protein LOC123513195 n=1 Tax=Portunus trituberculatus TaxID=210409 RepID=UPI001E1CEC12|nr:uncharacterized protein LOC123513195 [Portunus trituberculatus]